MVISSQLVRRQRRQGSPAAVIIAEYVTSDLDEEMSGTASSAYTVLP